MDMNDKRQQAADRLGIKLEQMPRHLAMIMDGNGRWAAAKGLPRADGHCEGAKAAESIGCCVACLLSEKRGTFFSFARASEASGQIASFALAAGDISPIHPLRRRQHRREDHGDDEYGN